MGMGMGIGVWIGRFEGTEIGKVEKTGAESNARFCV